MAAVAIIRAGSLIDATGAAPRRDVALVLDGTRLDRIEPWRPELANSANVLEFGQEFVLPGLVDAHCHLSLLGQGLTYEQEIEFSDQFMAVAAVHNAQVMLRSGVTTLRDNGARTIVRGPRGDEPWLAGGPADADRRPGHPDRRPFLLVRRDGRRRGGDPRAVRKLVQEGADHIKIMASGGARPGRTPDCRPTRSRAARCADAAHYYGG